MDIVHWTYMFNVSWCDVYFSLCWYYIHSMCPGPIFLFVAIFQELFTTTVCYNGKVLDRWQVSLKCSMTGSLCISHATWYCLFLSQSSTWCHFALICESFLSRVYSVCCGCCLCCIWPPCNFPSLWSFRRLDALHLPKSFSPPVPRSVAGLESEQGGHQHCDHNNFHSVSHSVENKTCPKNNQVTIQLWLQNNN